MKTWYYTILEHGNQGQIYNHEGGIGEAIEDAIKTCLAMSMLQEGARFTISLFDYPPDKNGQFGQAIKVLELNCLKSAY